MPEKIVDGRFILERSVRQVIFRSIERLKSYEKAAEAGNAEGEHMGLDGDRVREILDEEWGKHERLLARQAG